MRFISENYLTPKLNTSYIFVANQPISPPSRFPGAFERYRKMKRSKQNEIIRLDNSQDILVEHLSRIADGDIAAMRHLYLATAPRLNAIAIHFLKNPQEASDIVHDVYITVWQKAAQYQPARAHPMAWLTVITRNRCLDRLRHSKRLASEATNAMDQLPDFTPLAHEQIEETELGRRLMHCLSQLNDDQRHAITHTFYSGMTYESLAQTIGVPLGTVKSRIRRGLRALRACIES